MLRLLISAAHHHPYEIRGKLQLADLHARLGKHKKLSALLKEAEDALIEAEERSTAALAANVTRSSGTNETIDIEKDLEGVALSDNAHSNQLSDDNVSVSAPAVGSGIAVSPHGNAVVHPLLLAEAWYRVALVYRHHEHKSTKILRAAHRSAANSVRTSPRPAVEAVLLAYETAIMIGNKLEAARYRYICRGDNDPAGRSTRTKQPTAAEVAAAEVDAEESGVGAGKGVPGCRERLDQLEGMGDEEYEEDGERGERREL